jgi:aspartate carbamoyltransferase catalytic subunit
MTETAALSQQNIITTKDLDAKDIETILDTADSFKEISTRAIKKVPTLRGRTIINLFFEPSARTRTSFEIAGKRLSADVINISGAGSSVVKGESLIDTAKNLEAMSPGTIMPNNKNIGAHCLEIFGCVDKAFAFHYATSSTGNIDHISAQSFSCDFK